MDGSPAHRHWVWQLYRTTDWPLLWHSGIAAGLASAAVIALAHLHW